MRRRRSADSVRPKRSLAASAAAPTSDGSRWWRRWRPCCRPSTAYLRTSCPRLPGPRGRCLEWKRDAVLVLAALAGVAIFFGRRAVTTVGLAAAVAASALAVILALEWADAVPGTPSWLALAGLVPGLVALGGLASYRATAPRKQARA